MRLAILASHAGSTLKYVIDACSSGELQAAVVLVISNNSNSGAMGHARDAEIPALHISGKTHPDAGLADRTMLNALEEAKVDYVLLLGYMKKLGQETVQRFQGRIINTHPSLLPKYGGQGFFGRNVHEAVIAAGDRVSGASVHLVDAEYDTGPLLSQVRVPISPTETVDTLEDKVKSAEKKLLIQTLVELGNTAQVSNY